MPQGTDPNEKNGKNGSPESFDPLDISDLFDDLEQEEYESGATQKFTSTGHSSSWSGAELITDEPDTPEEPSSSGIFDPPPKGKKRRRPKRTGCAGAVLYAVFVIALSCLLAVGGWIMANDVLALSKEDSAAQVEITEDDNINTIADKLKSAGIIERKSAFKLYAKYANAEEKIKPGTYTLNSNFDYYAIVSGMGGYTGLGEAVRLSFPEGFTTDEIFKRLEENNVCSVEELKNTAANYEYDYYFLRNKPYGDYRRLEGYLFPDTYDFYENEEPASVLSRFLRNFNSKFSEELFAAAESSGHSVEEIIIIASMIEREAGSADERYSIASVIENRLAADMRLQIDATVVYALGDAYTGELSYADLEVDSPYNTYAVSGLPVGAICSPGLASIKAALDPAETNYYYYALGTNGYHRFFSDVDSFNAFISSEEYGG